MSTRKEIIAKKQEKLAKEQEQHTQKQKELTARKKELKEEAAKEEAATKEEAKTPAKTSSTPTGNDVNKERIVNASDGKTYAQGGLNLPEIKKLLEAAKINHSGNGDEVRATLKKKIMVVIKGL